MNSDGDKSYTKIFIFTEIYNFVIQTFFICNDLDAQIIDEI
jgi:hypothetical protein